MKSSVSLNMIGLTQLRQNIEENVAKAVLATAKSVRDEASQLAAKDTVAMSKFIYVSTLEESDYNETRDAAVAAFDEAKASGHTPKGRVVSSKAEFQGGDEMRPSSPLEAWVVVGMQYGIYVEFGTRKMAAQPFLLPAVMHHEAPFAANIAAAIIGSFSWNAGASRFTIPDTKRFVGQASMPGATITNTGFSTL